MDLGVTSDVTGQVKVKMFYIRNRNRNIFEGTSTIQWLLRSRVTNCNEMNIKHMGMKLK